MAGISSKAAGETVENKKKYNGIEFDNDLDLNIYEASLRDLDPQTGRWWQIDPKTDEMFMWSTYASNFDNPIRYEDKNGDMPDCCPGADARIERDIKDVVTGKINSQQLSDRLNIRGTADAVAVGAGLVIGEGLALSFAYPAAASVLYASEIFGVPSPGAPTSVASTIASESSTVANEVNLGARANEIHSALPAATQSRTTTAVASATTAEGNSVTLVGSSEKNLRPAQRAALQPGEIAVSGKGHAEQTVINHANANGMTVNSVAASRPICQGCAAAINNAGAQAASQLKKVNQKLIQEATTGKF